MRWKGRGSYTVEGTVIISMIFLATGMVILLGFYGHDRAVMQSTADELSIYGSLWAGRYMQPEIREGSVLSISVKNPEGKVIESNLKVTASDIELIEAFKQML